jgi:peptidoglycan/xylan/chitin deacetylase (PgdA/CDA1 family)
VTPNRMLRQAALGLAYFSGAARILAASRGGIGSILRFERIRPARRDAFQPLRAGEITPERLDRLCSALRRWRFDIVTFDEAVQRALDHGTSRRRFAALTFDGAYQDVATYASPVLARHQIPYMVFVPTGFVDGITPIWWLGLEQVILRHDRISLVVERAERHFEIASTRQKYELYEFLDRWMRTLAPSDLAHAIQDLCRRYSVDLTALSRGAAMQWPDIRALTRDPLVEIGSATVNYPVLTTLSSSAALREMKMGRQVAEAALGRAVKHFAFPFGDRRAVGRREIALAQEAGFVSAVTAQPRVVRAQDAGAPHALPRISWDGRWRSLRTLRVLTSGMLGEGTADRS